MTTLPQLKKETIEGIISNYSSIAVMDEDCVDGYRMVPAATFLDQYADRIVAALESETEEVVNEIIRTSHHPSNVWFEALRCARESVRGLFTRFKEGV